MYLSRYAFDGDPAELTAKYDALHARFADAIDLQVAVRRPDGVDVFDSCPTRAEAEAFWASEQFRSALAEVGLPEPRIDGLGDIVHVTHAAARS